MTHTCEHPTTQDTAPVSPRPEQGALTADNDLTKTDETLHVIDSMVDGLNDHDIDNMGRFFSESFRWMGNAGCGFKDNLKEFLYLSRFKSRKDNCDGSLEGHTLAKRA